jgi:hypothetical protein
MPAAGAVLVALDAATFVYGNIVFIRASKSPGEALGDDRQAVKIVIANLVSD